MTRTDASVPALALRSATREDAAVLLEWANDPLTRRMAFETGAIPLDVHLRWLAARLADPRCALYIVTDGSGAPVGQVRFDREDRDARISVSIAPERRGRGLAAAAIRLGGQRELAEGRVDRIIAEIRPENRASIRAHARAGFQAAVPGVRGDAPIVRMVALERDLGGETRESAPQG